MYTQRSHQIISVFAPSPASYPGAKASPPPQPTSSPIKVGNGKMTTECNIQDFMFLLSSLLVFPINCTDQSIPQIAKGLFTKTTIILGSRDLFANCEDAKLVLYPVSEENNISVSFRCILFSYFFLNIGNLQALGAMVTNSPWEVS